MKLSINSHFLYPGLGLAASISLMLVPSKAVNLIGGFTGALSGGYLASQAAMASDIKSRRLQFAATERRLAARDQELSTRNLAERESLEAKLSQAIKDRDKAIAHTQQQLRQIEIQRKNLVAEAKIALGEELAKKFGREYAEKLEEATADFNRREGEYYHAEGELCDQIEALQTVLEQNETYLREEFGKDTSVRVEQFRERYKQLQSQIAQYGQFIEEAGSEAAEEVQKKELQIAQLKGQLDESRKAVKTLTYRRFDTVGTDNILGNRLIDALAKCGSTYAAHHCEREANNGRLKLWLQMIDAPLAQAKLALDDLEAELNLWAKPTVKVDKGMHLFVLATEQEHKVLVAPQVPLSRLEKTLDGAIHGRIVGGSGSGKTVLLNNLMHYMAHSMEGANVTLLDPKAVDDWGMFTPRYWGEECVTGIVDLADGLKWRVNDTVQARKAGKPAPSYDPELFVLDEAQYNYLLAQNADDSHIKERGEQAPNYAKKAKGALAGLLSLGRAYNAIGLFVTQLPQVSKVGLNEGSFDPCVNIFLGVQIDNAIDSFLPGCGYSESKCKALAKELSTRRKLGQQWVMLVADLPRTEAYLMECPAPGYYHNRFSRDFELPAQTVKTVEKLQSIDTTESQACSTSASCKPPASNRQAVGSTSASQKSPSAHCPKCSHLSIKCHGSKPQKSGKYRFVCENPDCEKGAKKGTFSAFPLA
ncbi:MAG: hypothetical protein AAFP09_00940 [Cyanobacteria bacterium J06607_10]